MTQEDFDKLPLLLSATQTMHAVGCNEETLKNLRESNPELATVLPGMTHHRYVKAVVARLAKLKYK
jgi:hypothetical protein